MSILNNIINEFDIALKTLSDKKAGTDREYPPTPVDKNTDKLSKKEKDLSIQMMRVNHAGEVAAQALYRGQAFVCKDKKIKEHLIHAGDEETDHLVWCKKRLEELGGNSSILNPIWYASSFAIGAINNSDENYPNTSEAVNTQYSHNIDLNTSFNGDDNLYVGLEAGSANGLILLDSTNINATSDTLYLNSM